MAQQQFLPARLEAGLLRDLNAPHTIRKLARRFPQRVSSGYAYLDSSASKPSATSPKTISQTNPFSTINLKKKKTFPSPQSPISSPRTIRRPLTPSPRLLTSPRHEL